jgi:DNA-binding NtrC family response regulator
VRELENLITRACVLSAGGAIAAADILPWLAPGEIAEPAVESATPELAGARLDDLERATIVATLQKFGGNRARTAAALGIGVRTLSGKLRNYGFAPRAKEFALDGDRQNLPLAAAGVAGAMARRSA